MDTDTARLFAHYRAWADEITYSAVAALPPGEAAKERPTLFKNMVGTLNHNYLIDRVWQAHLEGRDHGFTARNLVLHADLDELWAAQQAMTRWYIDWAAAQSEASLEQRCASASSAARKARCAAAPSCCMSSTTRPTTGAGSPRCSSRCRRATRPPICRSS